MFFLVRGIPYGNLSPLQRATPTNNQPTKKMTTAFRSIPTVTLALGTTPDPLGFFESMIIGGFEGQFVRVSAASQKRHFCGTTPFGRRAIKFENGNVTIIRSVDFGRDLTVRNTILTNSTSLSAPRLTTGP